jgi:hypothetical protein
LCTSFRYRDKKVVDNIAFRAASSFDAIPSPLHSGVGFGGETEPVSWSASSLILVLARHRPTSANQALGRRTVLLKEDDCLRCYTVCYILASGRIGGGSGSDTSWSNRHAYLLQHGTDTSASQALGRRTVYY